MWCDCHFGLVPAGACIGLCSKDGRVIPWAGAGPAWRTNLLAPSEQHLCNSLLFWVVLASQSKATSGGQPGGLFFWRVNRSALPWCRALVSGWGTETLLTAVAEVPPVGSPLCPFPFLLAASTAEPRSHSVGRPSPGAISNTHRYVPPVWDCLVLLLGQAEADADGRYP